MYKYSLTYSAAFAPFRSWLLIGESPLWVNTHYLIPAGYKLQNRLSKDFNDLEWGKKSQSKKVKVCWYCCIFVTVHSSSLSQPVRATVTIMETDCVTWLCWQSKSCFYTPHVVSVKMNSSECLIIKRLGVSYKWMFRAWEQLPLAPDAADYLIHSLL